MSRYIVGTTRKRKRTKTQSKKPHTKKTKTQSKKPKKRKQNGGNKTSFLGSFLKPLVLPALFFGAQKAQQKRVHKNKKK